MWTGTSVSENDQWIELYNPTDSDINVGKWKIEFLRDIGKPPIMIPANRVIESKGYFIIANHPKNSNNTLLNVDVDVSNASIYLLAQGNGNLVLKNREGNTIDEVIGEWPVGGLDLEYDTFHSIQRMSELSDGLNPNSWYYCISVSCTGSAFWKEGVVDYGSPGSRNIEY
jgi:hypothetical protein